jgi:hypothetical protein
MCHIIYGCAVVANWGSQYTSHTGHKGRAASEDIPRLLWKPLGKVKAIPVTDRGGPSG